MWQSIVKLPEGVLEGTTGDYGVPCTQEWVLEKLLMLQEWVLVRPRMLQDPHQRSRLEPEGEPLPLPVYLKHCQVTKPIMPVGEGEIFTDQGTTEEAVKGGSRAWGQYIDNCYSPVLWLFNFHIHSSHI